MDIEEDVVKFVTRKISGILGPVCTDSEALQGWLLKFREESKILGANVEPFVDWLANNSPPWENYHTFISGRLISLDKQFGISLGGVGETRRRLFAKCVMRIKGPEATSVCQDDQICDGIKAVIHGTVHVVQDIWDAKSTTKDWIFLIIDAKTLSTGSIKSECCGQFVIMAI